MGYDEWYRSFVSARAQILSSLETNDIETAAEYFEYDRLSLSHPSFCPLFEKGQRCHDMQKLNCFFCACPYFVYDDNGLYEKEGKTVYSRCSINAPEGREFVGADSIHQDCSGCIIPHKRAFIIKELPKYIAAEGGNDNDQNR